MPGFENGMEMLNQKHIQEDADKEKVSSSLKEKLGDTSELKASLESMYQDMVRDNFTNLEAVFQTVKEKTAGIDDETLNTKLETIEAGIKDKEVSKYNAATKAVRELAELL